MSCHSILPITLILKHCILALNRGFTKGKCLLADKENLSSYQTSGHSHGKERTADVV